MNIGRSNNANPVYLRRSVKSPSGNDNSLVHSMLNDETLLSYLNQDHALVMNQDQSVFLNKFTTLDAHRTSTLLGDDLVNYGVDKSPYDESNVQNYLKKQPSRARKLQERKKVNKSNLFAAGQTRLDEEVKRRSIT